MTPDVVEVTEEAKTLTRHIIEIGEKASWSFKRDASPEITKLVADALARNRLAAEAETQRLREQVERLAEAATPFLNWADEADSMIKTIKSADGDVHPFILRVSELASPIRQALADYRKFTEGS